MSYADEHRSRRNRHAWDYFATTWTDGQPYVDPRHICQICGAVERFGWFDVGVMLPSGGCVALPAPAVSAPVADNLPRACE